MYQGTLHAARTVYLKDQQDEPDFMATIISSLLFLRHCRLLQNIQPKTVHFWVVCLYRRLLKDCRNPGCSIKRKLLDSSPSRLSIIVNNYETRRLFLLTIIIVVSPKYHWLKVDVSVFAARNSISMHVHWPSAVNCFSTKKTNCLRQKANPIECVINVLVVCVLLYHDFKGPYTSVTLDDNGKSDSWF